MEKRDFDADNILHEFPDRLDVLIRPGVDNHYYYEGWECMFVCYSFNIKINKN